MRRFASLVTLGAVGAIVVCAIPMRADAAPAPSVTAIVEARDAQDSRTVLIVVGKRVASFKSFALKKPDASDAGPVDLVFKTPTQLGLGLPAALPAGSYTLELHFGKSSVQTYPATVTAGAFLRLAGGDTMTGRLIVGAEDGVVFTGTTGGAGTIAASGAGTRFLWFPTKSAIRAGQVDGPQWDDANVGFRSVAMGSNTTASGDRSTAFGGATVASGFAAVAMGGNASAASGNYATAMGSGTTASGSAATAAGADTTATGNAATALGGGTTAQAHSSLVVGRYNVVAGTPGSVVTTDPVFVVGNGTGAAAPSNALTLLRNGDMTIAGSLTQNSDARLKVDVVPLAGVLAKLAGIQGVACRFRDEDHGPAGPQIGLLAQEVRDAFPELVREGSDGTLSVAYGNFTAVLLAAVKEQQAEIAALREELARTKDDVAARLARLEALAARPAAPATK